MLLLCTLPFEYLRISTEWLNFACEVIAHYDPKGSCARGHPSTPSAIGKLDGDANGYPPTKRERLWQRQAST